jgi:hypothetical protein
MGTLTFGDSRATVTMNDAFEALVRQAIDGTFPGMVDKMERAAADLEAAASAKWPVATGRSKAALTSEVRLAPDYSSIRARVACEADYARYIVSLKIKSGSGSAFVELLRKPTEAAASALAEDLKDIMAGTLGKGG